MKYSLVYTSPINSPRAYPPLSHAQVWKGLMRKCRRPQDFLAVLAGCQILHEDAHGMKRVMLFKPGMGPPSNQATELLTFHGQTTIDILLIEAGNLMTQSISRGNGANELYLTYTFDGEFLDIMEGTPQAAEKGRLLERELAQVVPETIEQIRAWVRMGQL
ncbi:hypothetical protein FIBSPDRAFT_796597 [Athelia psychrophila]|uniref:DUF1857 family protein n=1 Tax=Athelia psychrophila TaxID=1759441 RepID=A0A166DA52_9AGAM|nr:hypothetical protein FIBSPDRAFT_796597 [Fibularhizoctonia sp. CBS 109695]